MKKEINIFSVAGTLKNRASSGLITKLNKNEVFVFGSNLAGRHGAGAAKFAFDNFGAEYGIGEGMTGNTYALPTFDEHVKPMSKSKIKSHVDVFIDYAQTMSKLKFLVTEVGTGLGPYTYNEIAPMFVKCIFLKNVYLPMNFWNAIFKQLSNK